MELQPQRPTAEGSNFTSQLHKLYDTGERHHCWRSVQMIETCS